MRCSILARYSRDTVLQRSPDYASGATEPMHFHTYLNLPAM